MAFTFDTRKGKREKTGTFKFEEEKNVSLGNIRQFEDVKTPLEKCLAKIFSVLKSSAFKIDEKTAHSVVNEYKYMSGIMLANPEYIAAVLAMQIRYGIEIKIQNRAINSNELVLNKNYFSGDAWADISSNIKKSKKNDSESMLKMKMKLQTLNYAIKMFDYKYSSEINELRSNPSNEDIEREYAKIMAEEREKIEKQQEIELQEEENEFEDEDVFDVDFQDIQSDDEKGFNFEDI